jgi:hypothetical protein
MLSENLLCPSCNKEPDPEKLAMIMTERSSYTYSITHFDPNDPVIVSGTEIYCSTDCCVRAVVKGQIEYD